VLVDIASETGGGETGIGVSWSVQHRRAGATVSQQELDIGRGFLG
jgi:hypothetical protein